MLRGFPRLNTRIYAFQGEKPLPPPRSANINKAQRKQEPSKDPQEVLAAFQSQLEQVQQGLLQETAKREQVQQGLLQETAKREQLEQGLLQETAKREQLEQELLRLEQEVQQDRSDLEPVKVQHVYNVVHQVAKLALTSQVAKLALTSRKSRSAAAAAAPAPAPAPATPPKTFVDRADSAAVANLATVVGLTTQDLKAGLQPIALQRNNDVHPLDLPSLKAAVDGARKLCSNLLPQNPNMMFADQFLAKFDDIAAAFQLVGCAWRQGAHMREG